MVSRVTFIAYQSLSDWMKFAWLIVPHAFLLGSLALVLRYRLVSRRDAAAGLGTAAYTGLPDEKGDPRIHACGKADEVTARIPRAALPTWIDTSKAANFEPASEIFEAQRPWRSRSVACYVKPDLGLRQLRGGQGEASASGGR